MAFRPQDAKGPGLPGQQPVANIIFVHSVGEELQDSGRGTNLKTIDQVRGIAVDMVLQRKIGWSTSG